MATYDTTLPAEYSRRKKLAEALRREQERWASSPDNPAALHTSGYGAYPGFTQVNWGGILGNAVNRYMAAKKDKRATEEEQAAEMLGNEALNQILGLSEAPTSGAPQAQPQEGFLNANYPSEERSAKPNQYQQKRQLSQFKRAELAKLKSMGIDVSAAEAALADEEPAAGALYQAASNPAGLRMLLSRGEIDQQEYDDMMASLKEERQAQIEAKRPVGRPKTEVPRNSPYDRAAAVAQAKADVEAAGGENSYLQAKDRIGRMRMKLKDPSHRKYLEKADSRRTMDRLGQMMGSEGKYAPSMWNEEAQKDLQEAKSAHLEAMRYLQGLGSVSNAEQEIVSATLFDIYDTPEVREEKLNTMENAVESARRKVEAAKVRLRAGDPLATPPDDGWIIEEE